MKTCVHLEALERELEAQGIPLGAGVQSPYGPQLGIWYPVGCTFDEPSLRARLHIPESVSYDEYDGRAAGSDATWFCREHGRALWGEHPLYAASGTPRVR